MRSGRFASGFLDWIAGQELRPAIRQCHHYICHVGIRSIITALAEEVMPLVISRCHELGEHVDDHQLQITEKLADLGMIRVFHSLDELELLLAVDEQEGVDYAFQNRPLLDDIQVTVEEWLS